jgi:argininosuccinate lyase
MSATMPSTPAAQPVHAMWGGRFQRGPADAFARLNHSLPLDLRLWPHDVRAARAWVVALADVGVLDEAEEVTLLRGLDQVGRRLAAGEGVGAGDEDVHTLVERLLYEECGSVAGKLNTGRSRNDQVATDLRLWTLEALEAVDSEVAALGQALLGQARDGVDLLLPGYTHGQPAQPVRWGYVLLAHAWPLATDRKRIDDVRDRVAELPLGSGAVAGSAIPVNRILLKETLGFRRVAPNALHVTGDRDFIAEALFALSMVSVHVSRLASELLTYSSVEHGFVRLPDEFCSGSSLLPQKRNPDVLELARAKSARVLGDLIGLLALVRSLPAGYSKDLQEDKAFLFGAFDTVLAVLPAMRGAVAGMVPRPERMAAALDPSLLATDLAEGLCATGVPFREAHRVVGALVREAERLGVPLNALPLDVARAVHPGLEGSIARGLEWEDSVERRGTPGGSSRAAVVTQIEDLGRRFGGAME